MRFFHNFSNVGLCLLLFWPVFTRAQNVPFDTSFGNNGVVAFQKHFGSTLYSMALLPEDKIMLYAYWADTTFQIRLLPNGDLDQSFGVNGIQSEIIPKFSFPLDLIVLPNNKYLALRLYSEGSFIPETGFGVTRHHINGDLDTTFGNGGKTYCIVGNTGAVRDMAVQDDGKIVVLGFRDGQKGVLTRFHPNGSIDSIFGTNGITLAHIDFPTAVEALPNGQILSTGGRGGGFPNIRLALSKHLDNGSLDPSFAVNGKINDYFEMETEFAISLVVRPNGKIVLGGWADPLKNKFILVQYNSDGSLDESFGTNGMTFTEFDLSANIHKIALLNNGSLLATGVITEEVPGQSFAVSSLIARYDENGKLDLTYGGTGFQKFTVGKLSYVDFMCRATDSTFLLGGPYVVADSTSTNHFYVAKTGPMNTPVSVNEELVPTLKLFPNPTSDVVYLECSNYIEGRLKIFDLNGKLVKEQQMSSILIGGKCDLSQVAPGVYIYQFTTSRHVYTGKIVKN